MILDIPIPPSVNGLKVQAWGKRPGNTKAYTAWCADADLLLAIQKPRPVQTPVAIVVTIYGGKGFSIQGDISNRAKAAEDAIVRAGIIPDDNVQYVHEVTTRYVPPTNAKLPARATVEVRAVTQEEDGRCR